MTVEVAQRLCEMNACLLSGSYDQLEAITLEEINQNGFSLVTLNEARKLRLSPAVVYLCSLAVENDSPYNRFSDWLNIYQGILGKSAEKFDPDSRDVLVIAAQSIVSGHPLDSKKLQAVSSLGSSWIDALELLLDHQRYDAVLGLVNEIAGRKLNFREWLSVVECFFNRVKHFPNAGSRVDLGKALELMYAEIQGDGEQIQKLRSKILLYAANAYLHSELPDEAIRVCMQVGANAADENDRYYVQFSLARAYCIMGDLASSIGWLDKLLLERLKKHQIDQSSEEFISDAIPEAAALVLSQNKKPNFDVDSAGQALRDLQVSLAAEGITPFLVSGTLLGYAREGALLSHDKDVDVGVFENTDSYALVNALIKSQKFQLDFNRVGKYNVYSLPVVHWSTGIVIDIFIYRKEGDRLVTGVDNYFGYLQKFTFTPFDVRPVKFLGVDFYVPADIDLNLRENFGEWRVSDPNYFSHLESPATVDVGGDVYQLVGRLRTLECLMSNRLDKLDRVKNLMLRHQSGRYGMSAELFDAIDRYIAMESEPEGVTS